MQSSYSTHYKKFRIFPRSFYLHFDIKFFISKIPLLIKSWTFGISALGRSDTFSTPVCILTFFRHPSTVHSPPGKTIFFKHQFTKFEKNISNNHLQFLKNTLKNERICPQENRSLIDMFSHCFDC